MQQTALNAIAIGVFLMTLTSLLGPMFNLSPVIPAIATFTILGFATLDSFTWQGKGGTILLEWLAGVDPKRRDRIVRHEAGHFLVAYLFDIPITGYALSAWEALRQGQPGQGGVAFAPLELTSPIPAVVIERFSTVLMAGIAAETLVYGSALGGDDDRQQLRTVLTALGRRQNESLQQERFSTLQATTLIKQQWAAYEALVTAMQQRASVEECSAVIEQQRLISEG
jgi:hypothetical protein